MTSVSVAVRRTLWVHFCSSTILSIVVCLHNPQTEVCPLCARTVLGTTIGIAIYCISRPLFLQHDSRCCRLSSQPSDWSLSIVCQDVGFLIMTFDIAIRLLNPQYEVCPLRVEFPSRLQPLASPSVAYQESSLLPAQLSVLSSVFTALKPESVRCVLRLILLCLTLPSM